MKPWLLLLVPYSPPLRLARIKSVTTLELLNENTLNLKLLKDHKRGVSIT